MRTHSSTLLIAGLLAAALAAPAHAKQDDRGHGNGNGNGNGNSHHAQQGTLIKSSFTHCLRSAGVPIL